MKILEIPETFSTNSWLSENSKSHEWPFLVFTPNQTAGRGQRGNSWESETGKNLTASVVFKPKGIKPQEQFAISEAVALAALDLLKDLKIDATVKWPNDIYVGNKKIAGILIENSLTGNEITRTIAGIGLNINQTIFRSDAPNPVSIKMITGNSNDIKEIALHFACHLEKRLEMLHNKEKIHEEFKRHLWRGNGEYHPYYDHKAEEKLEAQIMEIAPDGVISLLTKNGEVRKFYFKEVEFLLPVSENEIKM